MGVWRWSIPQLCLDTLCPMLKYLSTHWLWHVTNRMAHASMMNCQVGHYRCLISKYLRRVTMLAEVSSNNGPGRCALQCGVLKAHKVLLSCCSNVYKGQDCYKLFTDNCWVYLMAELGPDCPVTIPLNSTAVDNSSQQQWAATGVDRVKVTGDVWCEVSPEVSTLCEAEANFCGEYYCGIVSLFLDIKNTEKIHIIRHDKLHLAQAWLSVNCSVVKWDKKWPDLR